jgi:hypothetical protein
MFKYIKRENREDNKCEGESELPAPQVKKGKWSKERERTKSGRWRKKRSDADQPREKKRPLLKYALAIIAVIIVALVVLYWLFPQWFSWLKI